MFSDIRLVSITFYEMACIWSKCNTYMSFQKFGASCMLYIRSACILEIPKVRNVLYACAAKI